MDGWLFESVEQKKNLKINWKKSILIVIELTTIKSKALENNKNRKNIIVLVIVVVVNGSRGVWESVSGGCWGEEGF